MLALQNVHGLLCTIVTERECCYTTESSLSFGESVALAVILTFLFTLVVGVSIGVFIVLAVNKCRRSENITLQSETEMIPPPVIYEEPDAIKPDPFTQGNVAYELVQPN